MTADVRRAARLIDAGLRTFSVPRDRPPAAPLYTVVQQVLSAGVDDAGDLLESLWPGRDGCAVRDLYPEPAD